MNAFEERMKELRSAYPGRRTLRPKHVAEYLGISLAHAKVRVRYDVNGGISLTRLARTLAREQEEGR